VYPALSVVQALGNSAEAVLWVGGEGGMEADLVARAGLPFRAIPAAGVHGVGLRRLPGNVLQLARGQALSEPGWFAAGNVLGGFHGAQWCYFNGRQAARRVANFLK